MPSYHPLGITVRLGSVPLEETITSKVVTWRCEAAKQQSEAAHQKLLSSAYLPERCAPLQDGGDDHALNRLAGVPFIQVQAGTGFAHDSPSQSSYADSNRQQALALHVKLSEESFGASCKTRSHLKIEVLFNGQLSACSNNPGPGAGYGDQYLTHLFAGYRIDHLAERPWVLLPPNITADGGTRSSRVSITSSERWDELSAAILTEARDRGTDQNGDPPPSARFLHALASAPPPPCIVNLQKPGDKTFGVVDVIITAGKGKKPIAKGTRYLKRPQKLSDPSYTLPPQVDLDSEDATARTDNQREGTSNVLQVGTSEEDELPLHNKPKKKRVTFTSDSDMPQHASPSANLRRQDSQETVFPPPSQDLFSIPDETNSNRPAPEQRSDGYMQPLSPTNPQGIYDTTSTSTEAQGNGFRNPPSSFPRPPHMPVDDSTSIRNPGSTSMPGDATLPARIHIPEFICSPVPRGLMVSSRCILEYSSIPGGPILPAGDRNPESTSIPGGPIMSAGNRDPESTSVPGGPISPAGNRSLESTSIPVLRDPILPAGDFNLDFTSIPVLGDPTFPAGNGNGYLGFNSIPIPGDPILPAGNGDGYLEFNSISVPGGAFLPAGNCDPGFTLMPEDSLLPANDGLPIRDPGLTSMPENMDSNIYGTHTPQPWNYPYPFAPCMPPTSSTYSTAVDRSILPGPPSLPYHHWPQSSSAHSLLNTYDHCFQPSAEHSAIDTQYSDTAFHEDPNEYPSLFRPRSLSPGAVESFVLPPTAMFSVTSKPQRSVSPTRSIKTVSSSEASDELRINRLVITGRGGATVLDHTWKTPQRIMVGQKLQTRPNLDYCDIAQIKTKPLGSKQLSGGNAQAYSRLVSPDTQLQSEIAEYDQRLDSHQDRPTGDVSLPYLQRHQAPADEIIPDNPRIDVPDEPTPLLPAPVSTNREPTFTADSEDGAKADGTDVPDDFASSFPAYLWAMQVTPPALFLLPT